MGAWFQVVQFLIVLAIFATCKAGSNLDDLLTPYIEEEDSHRLAVRQTSNALIDTDLSNYKICSKMGIATHCDLGLALELMEIATSCQNLQAAHYAANLCAMDPTTGMRCGAASSYIVDVLRVIPTCSESIVNQKGTCSPECRGLLQNLRDELGCCINAYFNDTDSYFDPFLGQVFGYTLWSACDVDPVLERCTGQLQIPFIANQTQGIDNDDIFLCSYRKIRERFLQAVCNYTRMNESLMAASNGDIGCDMYSQVVTQNCIFDENGGQFLTDFCFSGTYNCEAAKTGKSCGPGASNSAQEMVGKGTVHVMMLALLFFHCFLF